MNAGESARVMAILSSILLAGCGCSETGIGGDAQVDSDAIVEDTWTDALVDASVDLPSEPGPDLITEPRPDPGSGLLVPEGEATFYESDVGAEFWTFGMNLLPIAYSGGVYTVLVVEDASGGSPDEVAAYRFVPGSGTLTTVWYGEAYAVIQPSICWTSEVFTAMFPFPEEGKRILTFTEAGEHTGTETIGSGECGVAQQVMCPAGGPMLLDFEGGSTIPPGDVLHLLNVDGSATGTVLEVDLPQPTGIWDRAACYTLDAGGACFMGNPPFDKMGIFFFDREGDVWESPSFPATSFFDRGGVVVDIGEEAAAFWVDMTSSDETHLVGFCTLTGDGTFVIPPSSTGLAIERYDEMGFYAAYSGTDILLVAPPPDERGAERGTHLYLFDLEGNLLNEPVKLVADSDWPFAARVFWEGDAYAVIWGRDGGLYYQRFLVD